MFVRTDFLRKIDFEGRLNKWIAAGKNVFL